MRGLGKITERPKRLSTKQTSALYRQISRQSSALIASLAETWSLVLPQTLQFSSRVHTDIYTSVFLEIIYFNHIKKEWFVQRKTCHYCLFTTMYHIVLVWLYIPYVIDKWPLKIVIEWLAKLLSVTKIQDLNTTRMTSLWRWIHFLFSYHIMNTFEY